MVQLISEVNASIEQIFQIVTAKEEEGGLVEDMKVDVLKSDFGNNWLESDNDAAIVKEFHEKAKDVIEIVRILSKENIEEPAQGGVTAHFR